MNIRLEGLKLLAKTITNSRLAWIYIVHGVYKVLAVIISLKICVDSIIRLASLLSGIKRL